MCSFCREKVVGFSLLTKEDFNAYIGKREQYKENRLEDYIIPLPTHQNYQIPKNFNTRSNITLFVLKDGDCKPPPEWEGSFVEWIQSEIASATINQVFLDEIPLSPDAQFLISKVCILISLCAWSATDCSSFDKSRLIKHGTLKEEQRRESSRN